MDKLTIVYKSGQRVHVRAKSLTATWSRADQALTKLEWDSLEPRPIFVNLHAVESIWNGHV